MLLRAGNAPAKADLQVLLKQLLRLVREVFRRARRRSRESATIPLSCRMRWAWSGLRPQSAGSSGDRRPDWIQSRPPPSHYRAFRSKSMAPARINVQYNTRA